MSTHELSARTARVMIRAGRIFSAVGLAAVVVLITLWVWHVFDKPLRDITIGQTVLLVIGIPAAVYLAIVAVATAFGPAHDTTFE